MPNTKNCPSKAEPCSQEARAVTQLQRMAWAWRATSWARAQAVTEVPGQQQWLSVSNSCEVVTALGARGGWELYPLLGFCQTLSTYSLQFGSLTQPPATKCGRWEEVTETVRLETAARSSYRPRAGSAGRRDGFRSIQEGLELLHSLPSARHWSEGTEETQGHVEGDTGVWKEARGSSPAGHMRGSGPWRQPSSGAEPRESFTPQQGRVKSWADLMAESLIVPDWMTYIVIVWNVAEQFYRQNINLKVWPFGPSHPSK